VEAPYVEMLRGKLRSTNRHCRSWFNIVIFAEYCLCVGHRSLGITWVPQRAIQGLNKKKATRYDVLLPDGRVLQGSTWFNKCQKAKQAAAKEVLKKLWRSGSIKVPADTFNLFSREEREPSKKPAPLSQQSKSWGPPGHGYAPKHQPQPNNTHKPGKSQANATGQENRPKTALKNKKGKVEDNANLSTLGRPRLRPTVEEELKNSKQPQGRAPETFAELVTKINGKYLLALFFTFKGSKKRPTC
jgi:hypothetical protein